MALFTKQFSVLQGEEFYTEWIYNSARCIQT